MLNSSFLFHERLIEMSVGPIPTERADSYEMVTAAPAHEGQKKAYKWVLVSKSDTLN